MELIILVTLMYHIIEAVRQTDLTRFLKDIHLWLDHYGYSSECLAINKQTTDIILVEVSFNNLDLAKDFVRAFEGWALFPAIISELV